QPGRRGEQQPVGRHHDRVRHTGDSLGEVVHQPTELVLLGTRGGHSSSMFLSCFVWRAGCAAAALTGSPPLRSLRATRPWSAAAGADPAGAEAGPAGAGADPAAAVPALPRRTPRWKLFSLPRTVAGSRSGCGVFATGLLSALAEPGSSCSPRRLRGNPACVNDEDGFGV